MSDVQSGAKLAVIETIKDGVTIGIKNVGPILVNVLLWLVTIWIPYLNVGTTIGLFVGIVTKASRGEMIPMTEVFDAKYRKYMGEYFLTSGLVGIGVMAGLALFIIPGIIISIAWSFATLLVIDKGKNPTEAITLSNNLTYGYKAKMVGVYLLTGIAFSIVLGLLAALGGALGGFFFFLMFVVCIFEIFVMLGLNASMYRQLTEGV